jgi:hypothetical protein
MVPNRLAASSSATRAVHDIDQQIIELRSSLHGLEVEKAQLQDLSQDPDPSVLQLQPSPFPRDAQIESVLFDGSHDGILIFPLSRSRRQVTGSSDINSPESPRVLMTRREKALVASIFDNDGTQDQFIARPCFLR